MDGPAATVGIGNEAEAPSRVVMKFGHVGPPPSQELMHLVDVVDVELNTPKRPPRGVHVPRRRAIEQEDSCGTSSTKR